MQVIPAVAAVGDDLLGRVPSLAPCGTFRAVPQAVMRARYGTIGARAIGTSKRSGAALAGLTP